jgi:hypothetical protein
LSNPFHDGLLGGSNALETAGLGTSGWQKPPDYGQQSVSGSGEPATTTRLHPPSKEMQMPFFVRPRSNGKSFELRVKHSRLSKPIYHTFDVHEDAERAGQRAIAALDRGETPSWLERTERRALVIISQAVLAYRGIRAVPHSTQLLLDTVMNDFGNRALADANYEWAEVRIPAMLTAYSARR